MAQVYRHEGCDFTYMNKQIIVSTSHETPAFRNQSRAKLWIRTGIVSVFGILFGLTLYRDLTMGIFPWTWAGVIFVIGLAIGFWMRRWVPMQVHLASQRVTLSFDRVYFALIVLLVIAKAIAGSILAALILADVVMCVILGLMLGRLSGICLRVSMLKKWMRGLTREQALDESVP